MAILLFNSLEDAIIVQPDTRAIWHDRDKWIAYTENDSIVYLQSPVYSVEKAYLQAVLHIMGLLDNVESYVNNQSFVVQSLYNNLTEFKSDNGMIKMWAGSIEKTQRDIDEIFRAAITLKLQLT